MLLWPPCPLITWPNVLHGRNIPHFTIILSRSIVDPLWLSIAQSHTFVLNLQHLNPVARRWSQALNFDFGWALVYSKTRERHRPTRLISEAIFYNTFEFYYNIGTVTSIQPQWFNHECLIIANATLFKGETKKAKTGARCAEPWMYTCI